MKQTQSMLGISGMIFISVLLLAGCAQNNIIVDKGMKDSGSDTIMIGFIGPLTGVAAELGQGAKNAVALSVDEVNENGGVNGKKLKVIYEDTMCDPKGGTNGMTKLATVDKVSVVIGGLCSAETFAGSQVAEPNKVVMLSYCSSAPKITDAGDYIFRNYPSDTFQGSFAAEYLFNDLTAKKVAVLYLNDDWGAGIKDTFTKRFGELGGEIVKTESFIKGALDYKTQLTKINEAKPDAVYLLAIGSDTTTILKEAKELGIDTKKIVGGDGSFDPAVAKDSGTAGTGFRTIAPASDFSEAKKAEIEQKFGASPGICSVQAYDAVKIIARIISEAGNDATAIKDALYKISYEGESGLTEFDANGDLKGASYKVMEIQNGDWIKVK